MLGQKLKLVTSVTATVPKLPQPPSLKIRGHWLRGFRFFVLLVSTDKEICACRDLLHLSLGFVIESFAIAASNFARNDT